MNKLYPINIYDFLKFGIVTIISIIITTYILIIPTISLEPKILSSLVSIILLAYYMGVIISRYNIFKDYDLEIKYGIRIKLNGYNKSKEQLETEIDRITAMYSSYVNSPGKYFENDWVFIDFKNKVITMTERNLKVMGFVTVGGTHGEVVYLDRDIALSRTALAHELGHIILGRAWNNWDEEKHHKFMSDNNLR